LSKVQAVNFPSLCADATPGGCSPRENDFVNFDMPIFGGPKQPSGDWELFLGMWERANLVRAFFWTQRANDEKVLLSHFLARLRRYFGVDFCFGVLSVSEEALVEVGVPEASVSQIPQDFSRRCLESLANSRAPVTWKDAGIGLGFRSTVVAPLRAPTGSAFGFLMLGHARARNYTAIELFLLQALAGELSWVVRDLAARKIYQQKLAAAGHGVKNALQVIIGNAALIRQKLKNVPSGERDKHLEGIETAVQQVMDRLRILPDSPAQESEPAPAGADDIANVVSQSLASCQRTAQERGIDVEVIYTPESRSAMSVIPDRVKGILSALVDNAALATRNETVRLTVRRNAADLELVVKGMASNRVADRLKSLFEDASRLEGARDEQGGELVRVREYLDNAGGDVYLKSRPGEAAEFVVRLPMERTGQAGRL
jgi:signal transduction histidine kinase